MRFGWAEIFLTLTTLIVIGGIIAVIVWVVVKLTKRGTSGRTPLDLARERYAKGEITKDQFDQIKNDLSQE